jgi:formate dehydrogenase (NADP+) beta subunit
MLKKDMTSPLDLERVAKGTGALRYQKPIYQDFLPPCNNACPAGEDIQGWLALVQEKRYQDAWWKLTENNPLPGVHGRVCYHPCEVDCNRTYTDKTINIHAIERFLGDLAIKNNWSYKYPEKTDGKKVLVIGAGPSGLSAAYHLRKLGHEVEIYEAENVAGGMIHFGIPAYRMPRAELAAEIALIKKMGVKITLNKKVTDIVAEKQKGNFDAVFIAIGAHISKQIDIPGDSHIHIIDAITFLKQSQQSGFKVSGNVGVYGAGNTAMDVARVAKRLGCDNSYIIYRRDKNSMPAHDFEAEEAADEGVKFKWLSTICAIEENKVILDKMKIVDGNLTPSGEKEHLELETLVLAIGQDTESSFLQNAEGIKLNDNGTVKINENMMTGCEGIFAGGDMVPGDRSVTIATGHGKKAAKYINGFLRNEPYIKEEKHPIVTHEKLHLWFKTYAPQQEQESLEPEKRLEDFSEILQGLGETDVLYEARRCLSCGNCFECDGCYGSCPEDAIIKLGKGKRYKYVYEKCTGCAVCFEQCPCHAIQMIPDEDNKRISK